MKSNKNTTVRMIRVLKLKVVFLLIGCCIACQNDDDQPQQDNAKKGFWLAADKGYVLEINDTKNTLFSINSTGCTILEDNLDFEASFGFPLDLDSPDELVGISKLSITTLKFERLADQSELCLPDQVFNTNDPKINFDYFWNLFNEYYAFFERRNVDWAQYKNMRAQITSENFYDILQELILLLNDGHVSISDESRGINISSGDVALLNRLNASLSGDLVIQSQEDYDTLYNRKLEIIASRYLKGEFEIDDQQKIAWGLLNDSTGYINSLEMQGFSTTEKTELEVLNTVLDRLMNDFKSAGISKLIIDMRFNGGGYDRVSLAIASRFANRERSVFSKKARLGAGFTESTSVAISPQGDFQFTGEIILLTSAITASAAEIFVLCLKDFPYVTIVGENTNGIFSDVLVHKLPNGAFVGLSNEVYEDAQGTIYEGVGIGPKETDMVPLFSNSDFIEEKDSGIDRALEILNN
ncbi:S41 family peptidase [Aquimarina sp. U1-2]|uniref:S41 family peptidase n=1 Tax=Aquimarina sp. U1-2 TaxID=2823141 RepID=UPI001AECBA3C|nr:S41 family peptidase [Aquimarina sp. U1-2]MBP2831357.1 S41 family peptidase [Aquimarina sp. U1-2]